MAQKAFGKFTPGEATRQREWERYLGISPAAKWKSKYESVQNLLRHFSRYTKSEGTRSVSLRILWRFCKHTGMTPDTLVALPSEQVEKRVMDFVDDLEGRDYSKSYKNTLIKRLQTFFRVNGHPSLKLKTHFMPSRYRKRKEYIPTKDEVYRIADASGSVRNRALVLCLWSSGLRVSTLCALNFGDVVGELGQQCIRFPVFPEMKARVPDACKGSIPYYTYISHEATEVLKSYLRQREERFGRIGPNEPLFSSDWTLWKRKDRPMRRPAPQTINRILKSAAKTAGIGEWQHISAHCLRKSFESVLRSPTVDGGRMDIGTQQFLFGHILPGSMDTYYDKTSVEYHRAEYMKLNFARSAAETKLTDILLASVRAASAGITDDPEVIVSGYTKAKYGKDILWKMLPQEEQATLIKEAMEWKRAQMPVEGPTSEKVVPMEKVEDYLRRGWSFVARLDERRCVMRKRKG